MSWPSGDVSGASAWSPEESWSCLGLREVSVHPDEEADCLAANCEEWLVSASGGAQATLQEIRAGEAAGGFNYKRDGMFPYTANRAIVWKTSGETLELAEFSLNYALHGNRVKYMFADAPVLANGGVTIHETPGSVVALVTTVASVHRLTFTHPRKLHKQHRRLLRGHTAALPSLFAEATRQHAKEQWQALPAWQATSIKNFIASFSLTLLFSLPASSCGFLAVSHHGRRRLRSG